MRESLCHEYGVVEREARRESLQRGLKINGSGLKTPTSVDSVLRVFTG